MSSDLNDKQEKKGAFQTADVALTDELVSTYLADNPDFFNRNPELLNSLRLVDSHRGTVSLVERQQQQLREKNHILEEEVTQLMSVASHNEQLFLRYSEVYLRLLDCHNAVELLDCLVTSTDDILHLADCKVWINRPVTIKHDSLIGQDCRTIMHDRLAKDDYYFGRLQQSEHELIFSETLSGSVVLIKLSAYGQTFGFLALGSALAEHFDPRMDTLLLTQFKRFVGKLLQQYLL